MILNCITANDWLVTLVSILTVFTILGLISLCVSLLKYIKVGDKKEKVEQPAMPSTKPLTLEDITDEDMIVAALVATIDYRQTVKTDVRLVSIREIK